MYLLTDGLTVGQQIVLLALFTVVFLVGVYSLDLWFLTLASFLAKRGEGRAPAISDWPKITIQLPFYNEARVASRILESCLSLDYPRDRLEIVVIDDSNDGTSEIVEKYRERFAPLIKVVGRRKRDGLKAGALTEALKVSDGEFISVFDAAYLPSRYLLKRMVPYLYLGEDVAFVQARWGYIDDSFSWYAKAVALAIDIYGLVDQIARFSLGLVPHFNGTAAIFRKSAVERVGGWSPETLAEDLDLSIRLKLHGYTHVYLPWIVCPGEIPHTFRNLRAQQYRWARGFTECLKKYWVPILRSKRLSIMKKVESLVYLQSYLMPLLSLIGIACGAVYFTIFPSNFYLDHLKDSLLLALHLLFSAISYTAPLASATAAISMYDGGFREKVGKAVNLALLVLFFYSMLLTYSKAAIDALIGGRGEFVRTPKTGLRRVFAVSRAGGSGG
ncbi:MAG: glycosyltransferase [Candidatus Bathyarchaeia archaeon]